jgi:hypothetical protein
MTLAAAAVMAYQDSGELHESGKQSHDQSAQSIMIHFDILRPFGWIVHTLNWGVRYC